MLFVIGLGFDRLNLGQRQLPLCARVQVCIFGVLVGNPVSLKTAVREVSIPKNAVALGLVVGVFFLGWMERIPIFIFSQLYRVFMNPIISSGLFTGTGMGVGMACHLDADYA